MSWWTATHGVGAINSHGTSFEIRPLEGYARIRPRDSERLEGAVQLCVPRPPAGYRNISVVKLDFSSHSATVTALHVYEGGKEKAYERVQWTSTACEKLQQLLALGSDSGLVVVLDVAFDDERSSINLYSVGLAYA